MGSKTSKVQTALLEGKEKDAIAIFNEDKDFADKFNPLIPYENGDNSTPLHYAAWHAMCALFKSFLNTRGQNPMVKNARGETPLHKLCQKVDKRDDRVTCLKLLLDLPLRYPSLQINFNEVDLDGSTALHYAAKMGQGMLVEVLLKVALPSLTVTNKNKKTPADEAEDAGFRELATLMESKIVYGRDSALRSSISAPGPSSQDLRLDRKHAQGMEEKKNSRPEWDRKESENQTDGDLTLDLKLLYEVPDPIYKGLTLQALRSEKDSLMVTVSDILEVPLSAAEALLAANEWKKDVLIEGWLGDREVVCKKAGIPVPQLGAGIDSDRKHAISKETNCGICQEPAEGDGGVGPLVSVSCGHAFCRPCWEQYLKLKIEEGQRISCPGFNCKYLVPQEVLENLVVTTLAQKYLRFDLSAFVSSNPTLKWCPRPGCDRAVQKIPVERKKEVETEFRTTAECGRGHFFCFLCGEEAHEPTKCEDWKKWKLEVAKSMSVIGVADGKSTVDVNQMATQIWLTQNTKRCPKCQSNIQKNEGCNHMTCQKCRHEFCWICMEPWRKHGQQTGGFFSCNRYTGAGPSKAQEETKTAKEKEKESTRFVHFFERYGAHDISRKLEEQLLFGVEKRMNALQSVTKKKFSVEFIDAAFRELLKNRLLLRNSYVYRYYMDDGETDLLEELRSDFDADKSRVFETLQGEMETVTETLSGMVARKRMRNTKDDIIKAALAVREKRQAFLRSLFNEAEIEEPSYPAYSRSNSSSRSTHKSRSKHGGSSREKDKERERRRSERHKEKRSRRHKSTHEAAIIHSILSSSSASSSSLSASISSPALSSAFWVCNQCTLINPGSRQVCDLCQQSKTEALLAQSPSSVSSVSPVRGSSSSIHSSSRSSNSSSLDPVIPRRSSSAPRSQTPPPSSSSQLSSSFIDDDGLAAFSVAASDLSGWVCPTCTFSNIASETMCSMCNGPRPVTIHHTTEESEDTGDNMDTLTVRVPVPGQPENLTASVRIAGGGGGGIEGDRLDLHWSCPTCTYINLTGSQCEVCDTPKP